MGGRTRRQSARDVGLGGGSVEDLGMNASTLERIRFAAANRLCVDVGYEGDVQRVEPYSLRKARGGNVVLYACEAGSSSGMGLAWKTCPSSYLSAGLDARISLDSLAHTSRMGSPGATWSRFILSSALPPALRSITM